MRNSLTATVLITHCALLIPNCNSCAVANIVDILRTLKQKAIDSANDSNTDDDRRIMQKEVDQLLDQIDDNALVTFNGKFLVNGNMKGISRPVRAVFICQGLYYNHSSNTGIENVFDLLTELKTRESADDDPPGSLGIQSTDIVKVSHVIDGETYTRTEEVGNLKLGNLLAGSYNLSDTYVYSGGRTIIGNIGLCSSCVTPPVDGYISTNLPDSQGIDLNLNRYYSLQYVVRTGEPLRVPDGQCAVVAMSMNDGVNKQISSITITVMNENGQIKEDATRALKFKQLQRGESFSDGTNSDGGNLPRRGGRKSIDDRRLERHAGFGSRSQKQGRYQHNQHKDTRRRTCRNQRT